jgi:hypothetical protein
MSRFAFGSPGSPGSPDITQRMSKVPLQLSAGRSCKPLFSLRLAGVQPTSSRWSPPATDPLRVWPHEYDPSSDNAQWASDIMGSWHGVQGNRSGPRRDCGYDAHVMNYALMDMWDAVPSGNLYHKKLIYDAHTVAQRDAKRRNFYGAMQYIKKYPKYNEMEGTMGVSAGLFNEQIKPTIYALSHCMDYADENLRFWEYNHTEHLQVRVLWSVTHARACACASMCDPRTCMCMCIHV